MIENFAWVLPRPSRSKYVGSFPLHFERKLLNLLELDETKHLILHLFGGKAELGWRCDINPYVVPDVICDAHKLPFGNSKFDAVILDPPYSEDYSKQLYGTGKLHFNQYTSEAVRVCKVGGFVVMYHYLATPSIKDTVLIKRILLETRPWHKARIVHIHQKDK
jgi:hypothetical protein